MTAHCHWCCFSHSSTTLRMQLPIYLTSPMNTMTSKTHLAQYSQNWWISHYPMQDAQPSTVWLTDQMGGSPVNSTQQPRTLGHVTHPFETCQWQYCSLYDGIKFINLNELNCNIMAQKQEIKPILASWSLPLSLLVTFVISIYPATKLGTINNPHMDPLHSTTYLEASTLPFTEAASNTLPVSVIIETQQLPTELAQVIADLAAAALLMTNPHSNTLEFALTMHYQPHDHSLSIVSRCNRQWIQPNADDAYNQST